MFQRILAPVDLAHLGTLERALKVISEEKRQVLLDVKVGMDDGEK